MDLIIRPEECFDQPSVFLVHCSAFNCETEALLVDSLRKNEQVFIPPLSITASKDQLVVGHILISKASIVGPHGSFETLSLAPLAVLPSHQGQGIGRALIEHALEKASSLGYSSIFVLGHHALYPKFGFHPTSTWKIKSPYDVPENAFMGIELVPGALEGVEGIMKYPKEFDNI